MNSETSVTIASYRDLTVWQAGMDLAVASYIATSRFPRSEIYGLTSQIRRAASSVPANVAEGYGRETTGSYIQSLRVAQGSLKELETHVILAGRVKLLSSDAAKKLLDASDEIGRMLRALIRRLQQRAR